MIRRKFLGTTAAAAAATSLAHGQSKRRPNLLVIHCDELNFRTLGCYRDTLSDEQAFMWGPEAVCETPHIDSLAREGQLWTKCYAAVPVCSPSRSSLISGQYPQNTPVLNNNTHLSDDVISFAELLNRVGYHTGYAGKWHLEGYGKPEWEPKRRFGFVDNRYMFNRGHWKQFEDTPEGPRVKTRDKKGNPNYDIKGADEISFATDWLMRKAMEYVTDHKDEPFCYMLSIPDRHGPDTVRAPYDSMFDDSVVAKPRTYDKQPEQIASWAAPTKRCPWKMASYHGMVKCIDDNVGKMIAHLKQLGLYDNTIVIFTADHGDLRGEHSRQNKGVPYEASAKVPFVIRYPQSIAANGRIDHVFNTVDFLPSMLDLMSVETAGKEEGRNLARFLRGQGKPDGFDDITFFRSTAKQGSFGSWVGAVTPTHKLLLSHNEVPWLLNLEAEPDELNNLIEGEDPAVTGRLAASLGEYIGKYNDPFAKSEKVMNEIDKLAG